MENDLSLAKVKFDQWRQGKKAGERIPEALWSMAVELCRTNPIGRVHTALGVSYPALKARAPGAKIRNQRRGPKEKKFVTISVGEEMIQGEAFCEWTRVDGAKLKVQVAKSEVKSMVSAFLGGMPC